MPKLREPYPVRCPRRMPPGVHVMPFLSREGQFVLVALDYGSSFAYMASVASAEGSECQQLPASVGGGRLHTDAGRAFVGTAEKAPAASKYGALWTAGIYRAPWRHPLYESEWLAIDDRGRLAAMTTVAREDPGATRSARTTRARRAVADLRSLLDAL
jgi:hypothetical protein